MGSVGPAGRREDWRGREERSRLHSRSGGRLFVVPPRLLTARSLFFGSPTASAPHPNLLSSSSPSASGPVFFFLLRPLSTLISPARLCATRFYLAFCCSFFY